MAHNILRFQLILLIRRVNGQVRHYRTPQTKGFLIWFSSSRQVDVFDLFIKIRFFNSYLVSLTWLFSILFLSMLSSIAWFVIPSYLTSVLSSLKKGDCLYFSENNSHDTHSIWSIIANMFARHWIFTPILASTLWHCRFVSQSDSMNIITRRAMDLED